MKWATRAGVHIDRASSAWLIPDPVLWRLAEMVHEAALDDGKYDAPEAAGLDAVVRALSLAGDDETTLGATAPVFDALLGYFRRDLLDGHEPA